MLKRISAFLGYFTSQQVDPPMEGKQPLSNSKSLTEIHKGDNPPVIQDHSKKCTVKLSLLVECVNPESLSLQTYYNYKMNMAN